MSLITQGGSFLLKQTFGLSCALVLIFASNFVSAKGNSTKPLPMHAEVNQESYSTFRLWAFIISIIVLSLAAGFLSIILLAYMSIDELVLDLKSKTGTDEEKVQVQRVLLVLERRNLLFTALILPISASIVALPLLLIEFVSDLYAILISAVMVFIFLEIIPQIVCTGPNQLRIASSLAPITKTIIFVESPIAIPISMIIDNYLGEPKKVSYRNEDLKQLVELLWQQNSKAEPEAALEPHDNSSLRKRLLSGAIDLRTKTAREVMKDYDDVSAINANEPLTEPFIKKLREEGYSRYPIYRGNRHHVIGILLVKKLIGLRRFDKPLSELKIKLRRPLVVSPKMTLIELLIEFRKGNSHIALVTDQIAELQKYFVSEEEEVKPDEGYIFDTDYLLTCIQPVTIMGIVTLEDVVEKALGGYEFIGK